MTINEKPTAPKSERFSNDIKNGERVRQAPDRTRSELLVLRLLMRQHRREDCRNAKANFHFERTVRYRRSNDEDQKALAL